jgi:hypothetical protein
MVYPYRRNPTVFAEFFRLQNYLEFIVDYASAVPHTPRPADAKLTQFLREVETFPSLFDANQFVDLLMRTICNFELEEGTSHDRAAGLPFPSDLLEHLIDLDHTTDQAQTGDRVYVLKARDSIHRILHHFIRQHPINKPAVSYHLDRLMVFLRQTLEEVYATHYSSSHFLSMFSDALVHLERVYTVTRYLDAYKMDINYLNRHLRGLLPADMGHNHPVVSLALLLSVPIETAVIKEYTALCDNLCRELSPFDDERIYQFNDLHGLTHISGASGQIFF